MFALVFYYLGLKNPDSTQYTYDNMGRLTSQSTVSGGSIEYQYNALSLKSRITNAREQACSISYDALGRITGCVTPEDTVSYVYDANGNVTSVTDGNGTVTRTYDALNRVTSVTDHKGDTIGYRYDSVGNLSALVYPDGSEVTYTYDANNNLKSVKDWADRTTVYTYDANNMLTGAVKPDGSVTTVVYDNAHRVVSSVEKTCTEEIITGYEYTYDELGRIKTEKDLAKNCLMSYTYDKLSRITKRTVTDLAGGETTEESFAYDAAGNILSDSDYVYDTNNRLTSLHGQQISYDADGNMLSADLNGQTVSFVYDSSNRLISAGGHTYTYNAQDVRISMTSGGTETKYTYDTNVKLSRLLVEETDGEKIKYVYGLGLIAQVHGDTAYTYHFDCRGSTAALTDSEGIAATFTYDTYGRLISRTGTLSTPFMYNGRDGVMTDGNGLYYMRARYYSPELRRFINADIIAGSLSEAVTLNRYAYANGNPVSNVDPFGLSAERGINKAQENLIREIMNTPEKYRDFVIEMVSGVSKEKHYSRNDNNPDFPDKIKLDVSDSKIKDDQVIRDKLNALSREEGSFFYGWLVNEPAQCHQFTAPGNDNVKVMSPDGRFEVIYDKYGNEVTAPEDVGTYNFAPPVNNKFPDLVVFNQMHHFQEDVLPWIFWGNTPDDPTTIFDRLGSLL